MITSIGIDIVEVSRFEPWISYSKDKLSRVFSKHEIDYFMQVNNADYKKQFLASRFAAKEAFYKALCDFLNKLNFEIESLSFDKVRQHVEVIKNSYEIPSLNVNWIELNNILRMDVPRLDLSLSISHEKSFVVAAIIISLKNYS